MASHRLVFNSKAIREEQTQKQLTRLTDAKGSLKHDDRVDVLSSACDFWRDWLQVDVEELSAKNALKAEEDYINMWVDDARRAELIREGRGNSGTSRIQTIFGGSDRRNNRPNFLRRSR
mgnify:FL=1